MSGSAQCTRWCRQGQPWQGSSFRSTPIRIRPYNDFKTHRNSVDVLSGREAQQPCSSSSSSPERAQDAAARSLALMERLKHTQIDVEHILLALLDQPKGTVPQILAMMSIDTGTLKLKLTDDLSTSPRHARIFSAGAGQVFITMHVQNVFDSAVKEAKRLGDEYVSTEHIFLGILADRKTPSARFLQEAGVTRDGVLETIRKIRAEGYTPETTTGIFSQFSEPAKDTATRALAMLQRYNHTQVDVEHVMLALLEQTDGVVVQILEIIMLDIEALKQYLDQDLRRTPRAAGKNLRSDRVTITPRVQSVFDGALRETSRLGDERISTEHIFLGILAEGSSPSARFLKKPGLTREIVVETLHVIRANTFD